MVEIDLRDYIMGGYFITTFTEREDWMEPGLIPDWFISISGCIGDLCQLTWKWSGQQPDEAKNLGMPAGKWQAFIQWCQQDAGDDIGYPDTFYTLEGARRALHAFFPEENDLLLLGVALHKDRLNDFLEKHADSGDSYGVYENLSRRQMIEPGGELLGFDVLGYGEGINHSWLCYNLERAIKEKLDITPNESGIFDVPDEADKVREFATQEAPGWGWQTWLLMNYPQTDDETA